MTKVYLYAQRGGQDRAGGNDGTRGAALVTAKTMNPRWIGNWPAWDIQMPDGTIHEGVTQPIISAAIRSLKTIRPEAVPLYGEYIDVVRQRHIDLYAEFHTVR